MQYQTTYVLPFFGKLIYFQSRWHEDEEIAANRFFKMRHSGSNQAVEATPFYQANTDLDFNDESYVKEGISRHLYILNPDGGLTVKFYDFLANSWRTSYQGPWWVFVNQFTALSDSLYGFRLLDNDTQVRFLTLREAAFLATNLRIRALLCKDPMNFQKGALFIEAQINTFKKES
jgi:hypothetical protein